MQYRPNTYVIALWFVYGWFMEDEIDIQMVAYREGPDEPWQLELRTRRYKDHFDWEKSEDKKEFYDIKLGDDSFAKEEDVAAKIDKMATQLASGMGKSWWDKIPINNMGPEVPNTLINANKPWLKMTMHKTNPDGSIGEKVDPNSAEFKKTIDTVTKSET